MNSKEAKKVRMIASKIFNLKPDVRWEFMQTLIKASMITDLVTNYDPTSIPDKTIRDFLRLSKECRGRVFRQMFDWSHQDEDRYKEFYWEMSQLLLEEERIA